MWLLVAVVLVTCHRLITLNKNQDNILSDSTKIADGRAGKPIMLDTTTAAWKALADGKPDIISAKTKLLYQATNYESRWLGDRAPTEFYFELVNALKHVNNIGLLSSQYDLHKIEDDLKTFYGGNSESLDQTSIELAISKKFFAFTTHLANGRIKRPGHEKKIWKLSPQHNDGYEDVQRLADLKDPSQFMSLVSAIKPQTEQYARLEKAYQYYLKLDSATKGKFEHIRITKKIRPGSNDDVVPLIRDRIKVYNPDEKVDSNDTDSTLYDDNLVKAIQVFQEHHGLRPDGIIGAKTIEYLNRSFKQRAAIIALNMERIRWMPEKFSNHYIVVNIPEYKLRVFEDGKKEMEMNVVVGNPETPTPVFSDMLEHIVFSPTWTVPKSIIKDEIIPRLQEDPTYYSDRNYIFYKEKSEIDPLDERWDTAEVDPGDYIIVQQPGSDNALGQVKFVMPNHLSIYLHDTPQKKLFKNYLRAYSHGCIRVEEPVKLALYLLRDHNQWNEKEIRKAMQLDRPTNVFLKDHYEVHLTYLTAWVDDDGNTHFREDIYGHDRHQLWQLYPGGMEI